LLVVGGRTPTQIAAHYRLQDGAKVHPLVIGKLKKRGERFMMSITHRKTIPTSAPFTRKPLHGKFTR
jgi:hypothetical protein